MIEDLEGATPEPARRRHVFALSGAVAAVSLALFLALIVPPSRDGGAPQAASPAPVASAVPVTTNVWGPTMFVQSVPLSALRVDLRPVIYSSDGRHVIDARLIACADRRWSELSYYLVLDANGQVMAAYSNGRTQRSVPTPSVGDRGTGWLTVSCATSSIRTTRIDRRR